ncbi:MAG: lytic transglycosylase domain-containing protein [Alphaproteobacteria bacterium]|nr:MAG: lytic transglycosylase domain-containing protein [Alphaproteobacteria bacterium]
MRALLFLVLSLLGAAPDAAAQAQRPPQAQRPADPLAAQRDAIRRAEAGDLPAALQRLGATPDPLVLSLVRWTAYRTGRAGEQFSEVTGFIDRHRDWPLQPALIRRAEELARTETDLEALLAWFARQPPISRIGKVRLAEVLRAVGREAEAVATIRQTWVEESFGAREEADFLAQFAADLTADHHVARANRLLWAGTWEAAKRMLERLPPAQQALATARLALNGQGGDAQAAVAAVPPSLAQDAGLIFDLVRWHSRAERNDDARALLLTAPVEAMRAVTWWSQRDLQARRALAEGDPALAYRLAASHGLPAGSGEWADAEFLAGWLALRHLNDPARGFTHFQTLFQGVRLPVSTARGAYWAGRSLDALGRSGEAEAWYRRAAEQSTVFYGQLATQRLGVALGLPPSPTADPAARRALEQRELVRATALLLRLGEEEDIDPFVLRVAEQARTPAETTAAAAWATGLGRPDLSTTIARRALREGQVLIDAGWPDLAAVSRDGTPEPALALAVIRQESNFAAAAVSRAGARGLMQLMPATARQTASRAGQPYAEARLTRDPSYNVLLGRFFLQGLIDQYGGHYPLAIAAYNAGPGRVRQWLQRYGDPRSADVDVLDWIETIPFSETRNYVQRVLENLLVYRLRLNDPLETPSAGAWCVAGCRRS